MRGKDTLLKFVCLLLATVICLHGCSKQETNIKQEDTNQIKNNQEMAPPQMNELGSQAIITNIDLENNTITISSMFKMDDEMMKEEFKDSQSGASTKQEVPDNFDPNNMPKDMPQGASENKPADNQEFEPKEFPKNEQQTLVVTDSTIIEDKDGNTITINDLNVNDFVEYEVDGENLVSLKLIDMNFNPEQNQKVE